jgi:hypothetical protein
VQWKVVIHVRDGRRVRLRVEQRGDRAFFGLVRRRQMQRQPRTLRSTLHRIGRRMG